MRILCFKSIIYGPFERNIISIPHPRLVVGLATFSDYWYFSPLVIKGEYHFGVKCWWAFLVLGIAGCALSVFVTNSILSILCGVIAFSSFWSIGEVFQQRERVRKGWFPKKPGRD